MHHAILLLLWLTVATALVVPTTTRRPSTSSLRVKFDGTQWVAESEQEATGYGILKTFLLYGPTPTLRRLLQPYEYNQAVLKFMASEGCSRMVAQGNMEYYFRNPNDWFARRLLEERRGERFDYCTLEPTDLALRLIWTGLVLLFFQQLLAKIASGEIDLSKNHQFDFLMNAFS
jgi:hypothetical protein